MANKMNRTVHVMILTLACKTRKAHVVDVRGRKIEEAMMIMLTLSHSIPDDTGIVYHLSKDELDLYDAQHEKELQEAAARRGKCRSIISHNIFCLM